MGEKYNGKTLKVLHVADGKVETLTGTVTEGVLKVTVSPLGKFGTVVDASTVSTGDTGNGSGSGTGSSTLEARREQEVSRPVMKRICCRMFRR